jgi:ABC-2 type transport system ATP-binding protein
VKKVLVVNNLSKTFPAKNKQVKTCKAVDDISFSLNEGEILGLLGPNGAGKSTTISMLLGVLTPSAGQIIYFGQDFDPHRSEILEHVTFASTYIKMPWRLTVWENLKIYALLYGVGGEKFEQRAKKFLSFFDVWEHRHKTLNDLSAGQTTRVMLTKAFIPHPKIVLLDEPTASLDPEIAHQVRDFVKTEQKRFKTSILYTSHNMDEVADVCDRVIFLKKGKIVAEDTPEKLANSISTARMRLQVKDGLKRTAELAKKSGYPIKIKNREIEIKLDENKIAHFLSKLAVNNIKYSSISIAKPSLEDYFLSLNK